jgi:hypothetical protein
MVADLPERPGASQGARGGDGENEDEPVAAAPGPAGVRDQGQHGQQSGDFPCPVLDHAGHGGNSGMRHWSGGLSVRADLASIPVIKPGGRPLPRISAGPSGQLADTHPAVKSGTHALVAALGHITPTRRSRGHESISSTQAYLHADMQQKQEAIEKTAPPGSKQARYKPPDPLLEFLENL